jgi:hypothetical protein
MVFLFLNKSSIERTDRMTLEQALHKALEGGWGNVPPHTEFRSVAVEHDTIVLHVYDRQRRHRDYCTYSLGLALLDPLFWQALGGALGWAEGVAPKYLVYQQWWIQPWHRFIEHLAHGGSIAAFFETLA